MSENVTIEEQWQEVEHWGDAHYEISSMGRLRRWDYPNDCRPIQSTSSELVSDWKPQKWFGEVYHVSPSAGITRKARYLLHCKIERSDGKVVTRSAGQIFEIAYPAIHAAMVALQTATE